MARVERNCNGWEATARLRGTFEDRRRPQRSVAKQPVPSNPVARCESARCHPVAGHGGEELELSSVGLRRRSAGSNA